MAKNKQWKAIQVDWQTLQGFSDDEADYAYYKLTPRQAAFCQAWMAFGDWQSRWINLGEPMDGIRSFVALTSLNLMQENAIVIDCDEVEDCLEDSPTIINIENTTETNTTNITNNTNEITNNFDNPQDGNFYDVPSPAPESDEACQMSGYITAQLGSFIAQIDSYATEPNLLDALYSALNGDGYYAVTELTTALNNFFIGGADPLFATYNSQALDVQTQMYCENDFSKDNLATWAIGNLVRGDEISDMINCVSLATWERWQQLGQYETIYDCTSMCTPAVGWCYRFDLTTGVMPPETSIPNYCTFDFGVANVGQVDSIAEIVYGSCAVWASVLQVKIDLAYVNTTGIRYYGGGVQGNVNDFISFHDQTGKFGEHTTLTEWYATGEAEETWDRDMDWLIIYIVTGTGGSGGGLGNSWLTAIELFSDEGSNPFGADNCV